jgi:hypothetical protein
MKTLIELFETQFAALHARSVKLAENVPAENLFLKPSELKGMNYGYTFGELILRSAGTVEQTFGGITAKLWDDPFEWTLPEELSTNRKIVEYMNEVEATRKKGFEFFTADGDLFKEIPAPETMKPIVELLLQTISRAESFYGEAFAVSKFVGKENASFESKT